MLKFSLVGWLLCSLAWRTMPTACRQSRPPLSYQQLLAEQMKSYMDTTTHPCDNFYQYACGNWQIRQQGPHRLRQESGRYREQLFPSGTLRVIEASLNTRLERLLRRSTNSSINETPFIKEMSRYYRSCKRLKPYNLKKYLLQLPFTNLTYWPLGGRRWQSHDFDWIAAIGRLRLYGLNGVLLHEDVIPRWDDSRIFSIYVNKPNLQDTLPMGEGFIIELLLDIGQTKRVANSLARSLISFEHQLHRLQEVEDDDGPREMQLSYLLEYVPQIRWLSFLKQGLIDTEIDLRWTLIVENIEYLRALNNLVAQHKPETISSYLMIRWLAFLKQQGPGVISSEECVASMRRAMPLASSWLIGYNFPITNFKAGISSLFQNLKERFGQFILQNRLRLSSSLLQVLQKKLKAMRLRFGLIQTKELEMVKKYYEGLTLSDKNFYANQLILLRLHVKAKHKLVSSNPNITIDNLGYLAETFDASNLSPLYVKQRNLILVPHGLLQFPIWHRNITPMQQHAVLGFSLAHEIAHGFDMAGIDYDALGNIMGPMEEIRSSKHFRKGILCIQKQITNNSKWLNEKLADYEALKIVYETFFGLRAEGQHKTRNPFKIQFTQRQMFFISFAQFFCGKRPILTTVAHHHANLKADFYELRVMETLANFREFSRAFACHKRKKMQANKRCRVW